MKNKIVTIIPKSTKYKKENLHHAFGYICYPNGLFEVYIADVDETRYKIVLTKEGIKQLAKDLTGFINYCKKK